MNKLDIIFITILSITLIRGFLRGIVKEIIGIFGIIGAFLVASNYYNFIQKYISTIIPDGQIASIVSFTTLFITTLLFIYFLGAMIRELLKTLSLGWLDRIGGAAFGLLKGILISSLILFMLTFMLTPKSSLIAGSRLSPYVTMVTEKIIYFIPPNLKQKFWAKTKKMEEKWKHSIWYKLRHPEKNK
jgi:membrane protein required for colicin V production